jgi:dTDP-glucose 4,6-dehydratase
MSAVPPPSKLRVLVTGAAGFVGSHLCAHLLEETEHDVVAVDKLGRGSFGLRRLRVLGILNHERLSFWSHDLATVVPRGLLEEWGGIDVIFHLAAESHVDQSILFPSFCVCNNVMSTVNILEAARSLAPRLRSFIYWGTDEVHGPAPEGVAYCEDHAHNPSSPYAASKSASEQVANAYRVTYSVPVIGINCMNIIGETQACEKALPRFVRQILRHEQLGLHTYPGRDAYGTRGYIHVREVAKAALFVQQHGEVGQSYNIGGQAELDNLELAELCANQLGRPFSYRRVDHDSNRPGHDLAYRLDPTKLKELGWEPCRELEKRIRSTITWYKDHPEWLLEENDGEKTDLVGADMV